MDENEHRRGKQVSHLPKSLLSLRIVRPILQVIIVNVDIDLLGAPFDAQQKMLKFDNQWSARHPNIRTAFLFRKFNFLVQGCLDSIVAFLLNPLPGCELWDAPVCRYGHADFDLIQDLISSSVFVRDLEYPTSIMSDGNPLFPFFGDGSGCMSVSGRFRQDRMLTSVEPVDRVCHFNPMRSSLSPTMS